MLQRVVVRRGREHWQQEKVLEGRRNATLLAGAGRGGGAGEPPGEEAEGSRGTPACPVVLIALGHSRRLNQTEFQTSYVGAGKSDSAQHLRKALYLPRPQAHPSGTPAPAAPGGRGRAHCVRGFLDS